MDVYTQYPKISSLGTTLNTFVRSYYLCKETHRPSRTLNVCLGDHTTLKPQKELLLKIYSFFITTLLINPE